VTNVANTRRTLCCIVQKKLSKEQISDLSWKIRNFKEQISDLSWKIRNFQSGLQTAGNFAALRRDAER